MGDADSLARLHAVLLDMMRWFHALCADHHIPYYMIGGTMLGAARHGGFIPWDDDVVAILLEIHTRGKPGRAAANDADLCVFADT